MSLVNSRHRSFGVVAAGQPIDDRDLTSVQSQIGPRVVTTRSRASGCNRPGVPSGCGRSAPPLTSGFMGSASRQYGQAIATVQRCLPNNRRGRFRTDAMNANPHVPTASTHRQRLSTRQLGSGSLRWSSSHALYSGSMSSSAANADVAPAVRVSISRRTVS